MYALKCSLNSLVFSTLRMQLYLEFRGGGREPEMLSYIVLRIVVVPPHGCICGENLADLHK